MTCITAFATTAMATTQLTHVIRDCVIRYEHATCRQSESTSDRKLHMSWVVVTDNDGRQQLRVLWSQRGQVDSIHKY